MKNGEKKKNGLEFYEYDTNLHFYLLKNSLIPGGNTIVFQNAEYF